jgi:hypothetical protein
LIEEHNYWITEARKRTYGSQKGRSAFYYQLPLRTREQATDALRRLKAQIEPMVERHSKEMGVKLCVVCYKAMFSRRGVCNVKGWVYLLPGLPAVVAGKSLSHHHVKYHHQDEADSEAATITPDAKPNSDFCSLCDMSFFMKNTKAEPSMVPSRGIKRPIIMLMFYTFFLKRGN